jgi:hypothetical protein
MSIVYSIRWQLVYLDDRKLYERPAGSTIMDRWPNPVEMRLVNMFGQAVIGIAIPPTYKPLFYRRRSIIQSADGSLGEPQLDAVVFGYGRENGSKFEGKLWMWRQGKAVDCPLEHIDQTAIEMQLQA